MKLFFKKLLNFVEVLLLKYVGKHEVKSDVEPDDAPKPVVEDLPESAEQSVEQDLDDPTETDVNGPGVTHCLWKPLSDTSPELVLAVAADSIRREHLRLEFFNAKNKPIKLKTNKSYSDHRGNQLPDHKLGRFNFKPGFKVESLVKHEPITVKFFIEIDGKRHECKVGGLESFLIKDVTKRWVAHNKRVRLDPKK